MRLPLITTLALSSLSTASYPAQQFPLAGDYPPIPNLDQETQSQAEYQDQSLKDIIDASPFLSLHRDLVKIPSISGNESSVGSFLAEYLEARNFTVIKQVVPARSTSTPSSTGKTRFNIFAYPSSFSSISDAEILLTSHIDTVPPFIPYSVHRANKPNPNPNPKDKNKDKDNEIIISGRGTVDAKASVAAQITAALQTLSKTPNSPLSLLFVVDEEVGGTGMRAFATNTTLYPPSSHRNKNKYHTVIFGEPTDLALVSGHKGLLEFRVRSHGKAAHSGYPWLGRSAVSAILPALSVLDRLGEIPVEEGGLPSSKKYGRTTVNVGRVEGGVAANVVPAFAEADVAVRLAGGSHEDAARIIAAAVRNVTDGSGGGGDVEVEFARDDRGNLRGYAPQDLDADVPGFPVTTVNYGTDVPNLWVRSGVKRYLYGPGSIHVAHGDHEAVSVRQLEEAVRGYKRLIEAAVARNL